jgi:hypothetical protein
MVSSMTITKEVYLDTRSVFFPMMAIQQRFGRILRGGNADEEEERERASVSVVLG